LIAYPHCEIVGLDSTSCGPFGSRRLLPQCSYFFWLR
jgi:hypothetical protein